MQNMMLSWQSAGVLGAAGYGASVAVRKAARRPGLALLLRETAVILGLFAVWQLARQLSTTGTGGAVGRARWIWHAERTLHLPSETALQHLVLPHPLLVQAANYYYAVMHFGVMIAFLAWVFLRHREHYPWVRATLVLTTGAALLVQLVPVAPPRLLPGTGLVDTAVQYGQSVYGTDIGGAGADSYSAMPSLHIAWCALVAVAALRVTRSRWRWTGPAHAVVTLAVVLVTANHFWLDAAAALLLLALAHAVQWAGGRAVRARRRPGAAAVTGT